MRLDCDVDGATLRLRYAAEDGWRDPGVALDQSALSDEAGEGPGLAFDFTGTFVGVAAHDVSGAALPADFAWFLYEPA